MTEKIKVTSMDPGLKFNPKIYKADWMREDEIWVIPVGEELIIHEINEFYDGLKSRGGIIKGEEAETQKAQKGDGNV